MRVGDGLRVVPLAGGDRAQKAIARAPGPLCRRSPSSARGRRPPVPVAASSASWRGPARGAGKQGAEGGGPRASTSRAPTAGLGAPRSLPGLGSRPPEDLTSASRPASGREDGGQAGAPPRPRPQRAQKRRLALSSRAGALNPGTPRGRGQGGQNSQRFPAHGFRAASLWRSRPGGVAFPSVLRGWAPGWAS